MLPASAVTACPSSFCKCTKLLWCGRGEGLRAWEAQQGQWRRVSWRSGGSECREPEILQKLHQKLSISLVSVAGTSPQWQCSNITQGSGWPFKRDCKTHSFSLGNCSTAFWQDRHEMNYNEYKLSLQSGLRIHLSAHPVRPLRLLQPYSKLICHHLIALERTWAHSESKYHKWPHASHLQGNYDKKKNN